MPDIWADWLLDRRHGGNVDALYRTLAYVRPVRDRVLANARLKDGDALLDIGTGDGLIAFEALKQVGHHGTVVFSDVSQDLLDHSKALTQRMGDSSRCRFVQASVEDISPIADESVDVVTIRSVLIYVSEKQRAFGECFRVLRSGGRLSLFEPINRFGLPEAPHIFWGFDALSFQELADKVRAVYLRYQPLGEDPTLDFDERDLLRFADQAGFHGLHLELQVGVEPHEPCPWEQFANVAFNPLIPTVAEAIEEALTPSEAEEFVMHMRPLVENGCGKMPVAVAYIWAVKD